MAFANTYAFEYEHAPERVLEPRPSFEVLPGGGLDAQARAGIEPGFLAKVKSIVAVALIAISLGAIRVACTAMTVEQLSANVELRQQIKNARVEGDALRVERSVLGDSVRIGRIAEQSYGMVMASERIAVDISERMAAAEAVIAGEASATGELAGDSAGR